MSLPCYALCEASGDIKVKDSVERVHILRVTKEESRDVDDVVTKEQPITIILNNQELVTLLCSPINLEYLAVGFLSSEGLIKDKGKIRRIARLFVKCCGNSLGMVQTPGAFFSNRPLHFSSHKRYVLAS